MNTTMQSGTLARDGQNQSRERRTGDLALILLAIGTFAVGTEGFMIAGILPRVASDLSVSVPQAGQLVTVFALAYALSSPVLTAALGSINRRKLLIGALGLFALGNLVAASASGFWTLVVARVLLAFAAGLYVPGANALAASLVAPERRGRAIAIINGGITVAIALGVPIGSVIGNHLGWRMTFVAVAVLAAIATTGLQIGLPKHVGEGLHTAGLRERIAVARQPIVLLSLIVTTLWATGAYTMYPYLGIYVGDAVGMHGAQVGYVLFVLGISAGIGVMTGGAVADRFGARSAVVPALTICSLTFIALGTIAHGLPHWLTLVAISVLVVSWGISGWSFYPPQQARLVEIAGLHAAPIALSLNASFMYLGFSLGAATGSLVIRANGPAHLGWFAGAIEIGALIVVLLTYRRKDRHMG